MINSSMNKKTTSITDVPIKYLKMLNGDSVISYVHDDALEGEEVFALEEPMVVTLDGDHRYQLSPWFPFSKENLHFIDCDKVISTDDVDDGIKNTYLRLVLDKSSYEEDADWNVPHFIEPTSYSKH